MKSTEFQIPKIVLKEVIERVEVLREISIDRKMKNDFPVAYLQELNDFLLNSASPPTSNLVAISSLIESFPSYMSDPGVPLWQKASINRVWWHLGKYNPKIFDRLKALIESEAEQEEMLHRVPAQHNLERLLTRCRSYEQTKYNRFFRPFENIKCASDQHLTRSLIPLFENGDILNEEEEFDLYKVAICAYNLHENFRRIMETVFAGFEIVPRKLVKIWSRMYPGLEVASMDMQLAPYDQLIFVKCMCTTLIISKPFMCSFDHVLFHQILPYL